MIIVRTKSAEDTRALAAELAEFLQEGDVLLASGDLGAGKTTFAQGLGQALGIVERITSPTFVLIQSYKGRLTLHHADVFRLDQLQEVIDLGLIELIDDGGIALIEWGEAVAPVIASEYLAVRFRLGEADDERRIEIACIGSTWAPRESGLLKALSRWMDE